MPQLPQLLQHMEGKRGDLEQPWLLHNESSVQAIPQLHDTEASVLTYQAWGGSLSLAQ